MEAHAAADAAAPSDGARVSKVQLSGLALLKIVKHCTETLPSLATGSMLGLDMAGTLEVTRCFPFDDENVSDAVEYQIEMMKMLRDVNVDNNCVGWYSSSYLGTFCTPWFVQTQFTYQDNLGPNAVVVVFDPLLTSRGSLAIKALRLTDVFMEAFRAGTFSRESLGKAKVDLHSIFEEVPVEITNPLLVQALVFQLQSKETDKTRFDCLDLGTSSFLERNVELLMEWVEDTTEQQSKFHNYERAVARQQEEQQRWLARRMAENAQRTRAGEEPLPEHDPSLPFFKPIPEPSRLETLLHAKQVDTYCQQINRFAGQSFTKLMVASALHKEA